MYRCYLFRYQVLFNVENSVSKLISNQWLFSAPRGPRNSRLTPRHLLVKGPYQVQDTTRPLTYLKRAQTGLALSMFALKEPPNGVQVFLQFCSDKRFPSPGGSLLRPS